MSRVFFEVFSAREDNKSPFSLREPLLNSSLNYSETGKKKRGFSFPHIFNNLQFLKMAARPCAAGKSELIRLSLGKKARVLKSAPPCEIMVICDAGIIPAFKGAPWRRCPDVLTIKGLFRCKGETENRKKERHKS